MYDVIWWSVSCPDEVSNEVPDDGLYLYKCHTARSPSPYLCNDSIPLGTGLICTSTERVAYRQDPTPGLLRAGAWCAAARPAHNPDVRSRRDDRRISRLTQLDALDVPRTRKTPTTI